MLIGVCYRTNAVGIFDCDEDELLRELVEELGSRSVVLMGDFNYGGLDWSGVESVGVREEERRFLECLEENFYSQYVHEPTRDGRILDLVLCNEPDMVGELRVLECLSSSDHNMVLWEVYFGGGEKGTVGTPLDYKRADYEKMREDLRSVDWDTFFPDASSVNEDWIRFKGYLEELVRKYIPAKKLYGRRRKSIWITHRAVKAVEKKRRTFRRYKDRNHPACREANVRVAREVRRAKLGFEEKLAENIKYDSKSFFAYARSKSKARVGTAAVLLTDEGRTLESDKEVADEFNNYFCSVFSREDVSNIPEVSIRNVERLDRMEITGDKVRNSLLRLRADKSSGVDGMSPRLLVSIVEEICDPLVMLFRKSMERGSVPEDWRRANIVPIFKAGSRSKAENYRPVSLTSQICKVFEGLIRDVIVGHLERNDLLNITQHGFRKGRSCLTNLLTFLEKVTEGLDREENVDVIFLDFAKAFDKVPHERLLRKVRGMGIDGELLRWIEVWLKDRFQRVGVKGSWSEWRRVWSGVPQGSVLGPVLFLIFIDDLDEDLACSVLKFADDTKVFGVVNGIEDRNRLQADLRRLVEWSDKWQMKFNVGKCKVMHLGSGNLEWNYVMNKQRLKVVREEKDLGVMITDDLKVSVQCGAACGKASRMLGMMNRVIKSRDPGVLVRLYKSLVRPHLEYCTAAWSPHYEKDKEMLERVQRRFTRMIPGLRNKDYEERLRCLGLMTLEERRHRSDLVEMFKISRKLSAIPFEDFFELNASGRTRGHKYKLKKPRFESNLRKFFFSQRVVNGWNELEEGVVNAGTVDSFKRKLARVMKEKMDLFTD